MAHLKQIIIDISNEITVSCTKVHQVSDGELDTSVSQIVVLDCTPELIEKIEELIATVQPLATISKQ